MTLSLIDIKGVEITQRVENKAIMAWPEIYFRPSAFVLNLFRSSPVKQCSTGSPNSFFTSDKLFVRINTNKADWHNSAVYFISTPLQCCSKFLYEFGMPLYFSMESLLQASMSYFGIQLKERNNKVKKLIII